MGFKVFSYPEVDTILFLFPSYLKVFYNGMMPIG